MRFLITQLTIALFASGSAYCNSEGFVKRDGAVENVVQFTEDIATFASPLITSPLIYEKYARTSATYRPNQYPHLTTSTGAWQWVQADWWTAGFYPGTLYLLGERARKWPACAGGAAADWVERGRKWSEALIPLQTRNTVGHDTGFLSFPFVHELQVNPNNQTAKTSIQNFARLLANRYSSVVGATSSWDSNSPDFLVIIDNMMNLEVLFQAADLGSDQFYRTIARNHADKTAGNHLRADGSSFHVVNYNRNTGNVINKWTAQGYRDWSTWARGQAWGAYGYVMMFERTRTQSYLQTARRMAQLFVNRLYSSPATRFGIPPWDFDAPTPASADTSAAALAVTAFLGLSKAEAFVGNSTGASYWSSRAVQLLSDTSEHYFARSASWDAILSNGTSNHPSNVKDTGLVYGDYYYVMAGNIMLDMGLIQC